MKIPNTLLAATVTLLLAIPVLAKEAKLLFHADFNNGSDARLSQSGTGVHTGGAILTADQSGRNSSEALVATPEAGAIPGYETEGNINYTYGTLEFWYRPDFTAPQERSTLRYLFALASEAQNEKGGDTSFAIALTGVNSEMALRIIPGSLDESRQISVPVDWQANTWHHIAIVWDESEATVYIDGERAGQMLLPGGLFNGNSDITSVVRPSFTIGGLSDAASSVFADGLIDDLRIWDEPIYTENFSPQ